MFYENRVYSRESIIETMHGYQCTKLIFSFTRFAEGPDFDRFHARCYFLVVVGIILPSMPRFYSCPLGSCRRSPASCCCAGALDLPLLVLLLVFRIKFAEPSEHCLGSLPGRVLASLSPLALILCRRN